MLRPNPAGAARYGGDHSFSGEEVKEVIRCLRVRPAFQHVVICVEVGDLGDSRSSWRSLTLGQDRDPLDAWIHRPEPDCIASVVEFPNCVRFLRTKEEMDAFYIKVEGQANDLISTNARNSDFYEVAFEIKTIEEFQTTL